MKNLSPWAIAGIAVGGVAVVATGVVVAVKYLNKKKKKAEKEMCTFPSVSDEEIEKLIPTPENLKAVAEENAAKKAEMEAVTEAAPC